MVKIDLITGFLGSGKTTFIKKYVSYLVGKGYNVGILENDYGAVNVDMMLLQDVMGENCHAEMVAGGCGEDCHKRRFKILYGNCQWAYGNRHCADGQGAFRISGTGAEYVCHDTGEFCNE